MTKEYSIEQVHINVSGGVLNKDVKVQRVDIEPYLGACINEQMGIGRKEDWMQMWRGQRAGISMPMVRDSAYFTYPYTLDFDEARCLGYVDLAPRPIILETPLFEIHPTSGTGYARTISGVRATDLSAFSKTVYYWHEKDSTGRFRVWFMNLKEGDVLAKMVPDFMSQAWTEEIAIKDDLIKSAIIEATKFFLQQRQNHGDKIVNNLDVTDSRL